jgi:hypothetical protein
MSVAAHKPANQPFISRGYPPYCSFVPELRGADWVTLAGMWSEDDIPTAG